MGQTDKEQRDTMASNLNGTMMGLRIPVETNPRMDSDRLQLTHTRQMP